MILDITIDTSQWTDRVPLSTQLSFTFEQIIQSAVWNAEGLGEGQVKNKVCDLQGRAVGFVLFTLGDIPDPDPLHEIEALDVAEHPATGHEVGCGCTECLEADGPYLIEALEDPAVTVHTIATAAKVDRVKDDQ